MLDILESLKQDFPVLLVDKGNSTSHPTCLTVKSHENSALKPCLRMEFEESTVYLSTKEN